MSTTTTTTTEAEAASLATVTAAIMAAKTLAEREAAATTAGSIILSTERDAFGAVLNLRRAIGQAMYEQYVATVNAGEAKAKAEAATAVGFSTVMGTVRPGVSKASYEAGDVSRFAGRSWSTLAEDFALYAFTSGDRLAASYDAFRGDNVATFRGYLNYCRTAVKHGKAKADAGETGGVRAVNARITKAEAKAEAERQAAEAKAAADKAEAERDEYATKVRAHVANHPAANLVPGLPLTCADVVGVDAKVLREAAKALTFLAAEAEAAAKAAKAAKAKADKAAKAEDKAEATEAEAPAVPGIDEAALAAIVANAVAAAMAAAKA